jgi:hypothetical protein
VGFKIFNSEEVSDEFKPKSAAIAELKRQDTYLAVRDSVAFINFSPLFVGTVVEEAPGLDDLGGLFTAGTCWSWAGLGIVIFDLDES